MKIYKTVLTFTSIALFALGVNFSLTASSGMPYNSVVECSRSHTCYLKLNQGQRSRTLSAVALDGTEYPLDPKALAEENWLQVPYGTSYIHRSRVVHSATYLPQPQEF